MHGDGEEVGAGVGIAAAALLDGCRVLPVPVGLVVMSQGRIAMAAQIAVPAMIPA